MSWYTLVTAGGAYNPTPVRGPWRTVAEALGGELLLTPAWEVGKAGFGLRVMLVTPPHQPGGDTNR